MIGVCCLVPRPSMAIEAEDGGGLGMKQLDRLLVDESQDILKVERRRQHSRHSLERSKLGNFLPEPLVGAGVLASVLDADGELARDGLKELKLTLVVVARRTEWMLRTPTNRRGLWSRIGTETWEV